jgi:hypothetical protein
MKEKLLSETAQHCIDRPNADGKNETGEKEPLGYETLVTCWLAIDNQR